jgi:voltage-gated potassium channel
MTGVAPKGRGTLRPTSIFERQLTKFLREPPSVRLAASVIVIATALVVMVGGVLMRVFDHSEYASTWVGMWWALQTVTTVGYGDVTPAKPVGRIIASFVMFEGIALIAVLTAAITSTFVARAESERKEDAAADAAGGDAAFAARLDRLDEGLAELSDRVASLDELLRADPQTPGSPR